MAVVVNGHGPAADELLLSSIPLEVLDGATALADALGATRVVRGGVERGGNDSSGSSE
ncbi:MAG: hypothetical protein V5A55_11340 [Halovenus sp.]